MITTGFQVQAGTVNPIPIAGAPTDGTNEVHTATIGGTPTGGTFTLVFLGATTAPISWSSTNATLVANIQAALIALPTIGTSGVTVAVGTATAGIGTFTITFGGNLAVLALNGVISVGANNMTGSTPTIAVAQTTSGVTASRRSAGFGAVLLSDNGKTYTNSSQTALAPTWVVTGSQS